MTVADDFLQGVRDAMATFGRNVSWTRYSDSYSAATGVSTRTATTSTITATDAIPNNKRLRPGTTTDAGDAVCYVPAEGLTFTPTTGDKVTIDSVAWTVIGTQFFSVLGTGVLYACELRRAS